jgi:hypothetical protein
VNKAVAFFAVFVGLLLIYLLFSGNIATFLAALTQPALVRVNK